MHFTVFLKRGSIESPWTPYAVVDHMGAHSENSQQQEEQEVQDALNRYGKDEGTYWKRVTIRA